MSSVAMLHQLQNGRIMAENYEASQGTNILEEARFLQEKRQVVQITIAVADTSFYVWDWSRQ